MKKGIHPKYYDKTIVKCACGNQFEIGSTAKEIHIEVCSKCHPFFTGKQKFVDTTGRVENFMKKYKKFYDNQNKNQSDQGEKKD